MNVFLASAGNQGATTLAKHLVAPNLAKPLLIQFGGDVYGEPKDYIKIDASDDHSYQLADELLKPGGDLVVNIPVHQRQKALSKLIEFPTAVSRIDLWILPFTRGAGDKTVALAKHLVGLGISPQKIVGVMNMVPRDWREEDGYQKEIDLVRANSSLIRTCSQPVQKSPALASRPWSMNGKSVYFQEKGEPDTALKDASSLAVANLDLVWGEILDVSGIA